MTNPHQQPCAPCARARAAAYEAARNTARQAAQGNVAGTAKAAIETGRVLADGAMKLVGMRPKDEEPPA